MVPLLVAKLIELMKQNNLRSIAVVYKIELRLHCNTDALRISLRSQKYGNTSKCLTAILRITSQCLFLTVRTVSITISHAHWLGAPCTVQFKFSIAQSNHIDCRIIKQKLRNSISLHCWEASRATNLKKLPAKNLAAVADVATWLWQKETYIKKVSQTIYAFWFSGFLGLMYAKTEHCLSHIEIVNVVKPSRLNKDEWVYADSIDGSSVDTIGINSNLTSCIRTACKLMIIV
jgi:hypothetical protein